MCASRERNEKSWIDILVQALQFDGDVVPFESKFNTLIRQVIWENYVKNEREVLEAVLKKDGLLIQYDAYKLDENTDYVSIAVSQNGMALNFASEDLKKDFTIVKKAVRNNGLALQYSEEFQNNFEIVEEAVSQNGMALKFASEDLKKDSKIVKKAVRNNGLVLQYSEEFQNDFKIVEEAVSQNGMALVYASKDLKKDSKIVKKAVKKDPLALKYVSDSYIKEHLDWFQEINGYGLYKFLLFNFDDFKISWVFNSLKEIVVHGTDNDERKMLFGNKRILNECLKINGLYLKEIPEEYKDEELVKTALVQNAKAWSFTPTKYKKIGNFANIPY